MSGVRVLAEGGGQREGHVTVKGKEEEIGDRGGEAQPKGGTPCRGLGLCMSKRCRGNSNQIGGGGPRKGGGRPITGKKKDYRDGKRWEKSYRSTPEAVT